MKELAEKIYELSATNSRTTKAALLSKYADVPGFKEVLKFVFNPYIKTGIATKKLNKGKHNEAHPNAIGYQTIIDYFTEHTTGSDADINMAWRFINAQEGIRAKDLVSSIITGTLKLGVTATSLNAAYGTGFIPVVGVMLANRYYDRKDKVNGPFIATKKHDGNRRTIVKNNGLVKFYTRSGHEDVLPKEWVHEVSLLPDNMVYDGETLALGTFSDAIEQRQATASIMNSDGEKSGVYFEMFDMLPVEQFFAGRSVDTALVRKVAMGALFGDESIKHLTQNYKDIIAAARIPYDFKFLHPTEILGVVSTEEEIIAIVEPIWARREEGIMLNAIYGAYEVKRTDAILKLKHFEEIELRVIDIEEGKGRNAGRTGTIVVDYKGYRVGCGSGLTDSLRDDIWNNKDKYIGVLCTIEHQGESKNKDGGLSLNCPIFQGFRYDK